MRSSGQPTSTPQETAGALPNGQPDLDSSGPFRSAVRDLLEAFPSPAVVFDAETWKPLEFNDGAAQMMGYSRDEFATLAITDLEAIPSPGETAEHMRSIRQQVRDTFVRTHRRKDGTRMRVLISTRTTNWFGRSAVMTTWHDTSARAALANGVVGAPMAESNATTEFAWADAISGRFLELTDRVAATDTTVLVTGETGSGKEIIARRIHAHSRRSSGPFIAVNCAALPSELVESELFGHVRGAFSGATSDREGSFAQANGGTLFLDEVGELPLATQPKLLRVLEDRIVQPLGATAAGRVDVRILAATNRDLATSVRDGQFRSDLLYRLNAFSLAIPALRARSRDIPALATHFLRRLEAELEHPIGPLSMDDSASLEAYDWPGNVRELQNVLRRAAILSEPNELELPVDWRGAPTMHLDESARGDDLESWTKAHLVKTLYACDWMIEGKNGAAHRLGMAPSTLRSKMRKLNIERP